MVRIKFLQQRLVSGFWKPAFFIEQSKNTHGALDKVDCRLEIETKVDERPLNTFALVFVLFQDKHRRVKELLQLLVGVVNAKLFKRVEVEDLEASNVKYADKRSAL